MPPKNPASKTAKKAPATPKKKNANPKATTPKTPATASSAAAAGSQATATPSPTKKRLDAVLLANRQNPWGVRVYQAAPSLAAYLNLATTLELRALVKTPTPDINGRDSAFIGAVIDEFRTAFPDFRYSGARIKALMADDDFDAQVALRLFPDATFPLKESDAVPVRAAKSLSQPHQRKSVKGHSGGQARLFTQFDIDNARQYHNQASLDEDVSDYVPMSDNEKYAEEEGSESGRAVQGPEDLERTEKAVANALSQSTRNIPRRKTVPLAHLVDVLTSLYESVKMRGLIAWPKFPNAPLDPLLARETSIPMNNIEIEVDQTAKSVMEQNQRKRRTAADGNTWKVKGN
ncbi:uncharacterized protein J3D65DRAFT_602297 [Phyllosticta citribraziliensis]|uniref:Uncharacterized protein n=1 Tax=Phyllosticta citribraziliensis TaxID=989973 RepID=A0ABR1LSX8_9PEZI